MKLSSLKPGMWVEFKCYGTTYFAEILEIEGSDLRSAMWKSIHPNAEWQNREGGLGFFLNPTNIKLTSVRP